MKALLKLILPILILVSFAKAQVVLPLGLGQKQSINLTCASNDKLWVLSEDQQKFVVSKWDGNFWIEYSDIPASFLSSLSSQNNLIKAKAITFYKNEFYIVFTNTSSQSILILKSNGRTWEVINTDKVKVENDLKFLSDNDALYLCGKIDFDGQKAAILKVEDSNTSIYAYSPAFQSSDDFYSDFENAGGKIYAIGLFSSPLDPNKRYFTSFDNGVWKIVDNPPGLFGFTGLGNYNDRLVIVAKDISGKLSIIFQNHNQSVWDNIITGLEDWTINSVSNIHQVGKILWVAGDFTNTKLNRQTSLAFWDGKSWNFPDFDYLGNDLTVHGDRQTFICGSFLSHQGLLLNKVGELKFGTALIAGKVFKDNNQNCSQDFGEESLQGALVKLTPENVYAISDYNGRYYFPVDSNTKIHGVELQVPKYHVPTCDGFKATKHFNKLTLAGLDFGIMPNGNHTDAEVSIQDFTGWRARQGFDEKYKLCAVNNGTVEITSGKLVLKTDERILNWVFSETPSVMKLNTYEWNLRNLKAGEKQCIDIVATISMELALSSKVLFDAKVYTTDVQDEDLSDNQDLLTQTVVAGIDPNDKKTQQDFWIAPLTPKLDYKIRFQNMGSDTAYDVYVTDTIDPNLYIDKEGVRFEFSVEPKFTSESWILSNGNYRYKFAWRFNDIKLPDDKTNEPASHGFINYSLKVRPEAKVGTLLRNRAFIYFDFQEPILTNTAVNLISLNTGVKHVNALNQLSIHPNPAKDLLNISNPFEKEIRVSIINTLGQTVRSETIPADETLSIQTAGMAKGLYLIQAEGYAPVKVVLY
jgi:hypothetical protein